MATAYVLIWNTGSSVRALVMITVSGFVAVAVSPVQPMKLQPVAGVAVS